MITASMRQRAVLGIAARGVALVVVAAVAGGCKTGTSSWTAKPSWWTFGGSSDASKLASAPPAPTDVTKPSAVSSPYPTTTTPEGYVMDKSTAAPGAQVAGAPRQQPVDPAAVTYGSQPPASAAEPQAGATAAASPAGASAGGLSSISPQVGPYGNSSAAAVPPERMPSAATTAAYAAGAPAAPAGSAFGAAAADPRLDTAGTRVADARAADGWPSSPPAPTTTDSRYGAANGSRFSGGVSPPASAPVSAFGAPAAPPAEMAPASQPLPSPAAAPAAPPTSALPATPTRRPDPGYRPGGTSSYRPSRTILAGDEGTPDPAVRLASCQSELPAGQ
jgi:hypothetical protein